MDGWSGTEVELKDSHPSVSKEQDAKDQHQYLQVELHNHASSDSLQEGIRRPSCITFKLRSLSHSYGWHNLGKMPLLQANLGSKIKATGASFGANQTDFLPLIQSGGKCYRLAVKLQSRALARLPAKLQPTKNSAKIASGSVGDAGIILVNFEDVGRLLLRHVS